MDINTRNVIRFFSLLILQISVVNYINFGGYINPQVYILYVIFFPYYYGNKSYLLLSSFFLGISIDFFMNSGGINAFSLTTIAYIRQSLFDFLLGKQDVKKNIDLTKFPSIKTIFYIFTITFIHHTILFWLENFSFNELGSMTIRILLSTLCTTLLNVLLMYIFAKKTDRRL